MKEIDIEDPVGLEEYLRRYGHLTAQETVTFQKLSGGVSNKTVKVSWPDGHGWVLKQALSKLRVTTDWFSNPERIKVEAKAIRWLNRLAPPGTIPVFLWEDPANHMLAMEAVPEAHENWKSLLLAGKVISDHFRQFGSLLGTIHRRSSEDAAEVRPAFESRTYFETLRLEPYYIYTAEKAPAGALFLQALVQETMVHRLCLVHGDFSPKNTLVYEDRLILIDHEVVHFGEPAFDLGFALTHFLSKWHHLPDHRDCLANGALVFWQEYEKEISCLPWASELEPRIVRHTLGCLLARVAGKSPLEYLPVATSRRQSEAVLLLMAEPPRSVANLIDQFTNRVKKYAYN
jgi:5-methylthioribose kinase